MTHPPAPPHLHYRHHAPPRATTHRLTSTAAADRYAAVLLLVMLLLNMLIVVLMEAFDAVREAQKEDRLVDNTASGELLTALPGWQPLRRGVYSPWARLELWLHSLPEEARMHA